MRHYTMSNGILHRDGTISFFSERRGRWLARLREDDVTEFWVDEFADLREEDKAAALAHFARHRERRAIGRALKGGGAR